MTTYAPQPAMPGGPANPPCINCGAAFRLHRYQAPLTPSHPVDAARRGRLTQTTQGLAKLLAMGAKLDCPVAYRPDDLAAAQQQLDVAMAGGDESRIFVARGNLQRLQGRGPKPYNPADYVDSLFPQGRPACDNCGVRPVYMAGKCGECWAAVARP